MGDIVLNESTTTPSPLDRLARLLGLDLSYETIWGHTRTVDPLTAKAILHSLAGTPLDLDDPQAIEAYLAVATRVDQLPATLVETTATALAKLSDRLTKEEQAHPIHLYIEWENQATTHSPYPNPHLRPVDGYHKLTVHTYDRQLRLRWILTPDHCHLPAPDEHLNGINCFLPSLRSTRNWGAGDLTDLTQFATHLAAANFDFIALNPLHSIHNRTPYNTSPYLPLSIFTGNLLYLDIEAIPEFQQSRWAQNTLNQPSFQQQLDTLRNSEFVDYERVARLKTYFLLILYRQFLRMNHNELAQYRQARGAWLDNYCTYMAFDRYFHRHNPDLWHWRHWPTPYQDPHSQASRELAHKLRRLIDFYAYVEMRLDQQLAAAHQKLLSLNYKIGLYQDLALATDRVGADYWAYQSLFAPGVRVGSPPDDFNENGQDWGFPALHPHRHADSGYRYFIESIRCAARHAGAIRLDHVMRLARLYWIPDHHSARDGAYVRDHFEDLLGILSLESQRGKFIVVGEDLGTVPAYFRKALLDCGILSYRLILFEKDGAAFKPASTYPTQAIASFTTHDLPTFDGWLRGADLDARLEIGQLSPAERPAAVAARVEAVNALRQAFDIEEDAISPQLFFAGLSQFLAATPSQLRLLNLEELDAELHQQNLPGTTSEAPNWRRRIHCTMDQLFLDPQFTERLSTWVQAMRREVRP